MNKRNVVFTFFSCIFWSATMFAQGNDSILYEPLRMIRLNQENDLYQVWYQSDKNFTGGLGIEVFHPKADNKFIRAILPGCNHSSLNDFSLSLTQDIFTPENIQLKRVDSMDRPYTALLYLTFARYTNDLLKGRKLSSRIFLGVQGKKALGQEMQNGTHLVFGNKKANGWQNQLGSGLMADYELEYQAILPVTNQFFESNYFGKAHLGTIYDNVSAGLLFKVGYYADTYVNRYGVVNYRNKKYYSPEMLASMGNSKRKMIPRRIRDRSVSEQLSYLNDRMNRKFQFYMHFMFMANYMIYNGTVEGSLVPFSGSRYVQTTVDSREVIMVGAYGLHLQYHRLSLNFNRYLLNEDYGNDEVFGFGQVVVAYIL